MKQFLMILTLVWTCLSPSLACADGIEKWFFAYVDLLRDPVLEGDETNYTAKELMALFEKLEEHKYTVVVLSSFQLGDKAILDPTDASPSSQTIRKSLADIKAAASKYGIEIIPEVMPVGASESILQDDLHLADGTPVREMLFHVAKSPDGELFATPDRSSVLPRGDFSGTIEESASHWGFDPNAPGIMISHEAPPQSSASLEFHFGDQLEKELALNAQQKTANGELTSWHAIKPWHQYRLSFAIRTSGLATPAEDLGFYAEVTGRLESKPDAIIYPLERVTDSIMPTQKWTLYSTILNSYEFKEAQLWIGSNEITAGHLWITNIRLEEVGGANLIRRSDLAETPDLDESLPLKVRLVETHEELKEGHDFTRWEDDLVAKTGWFQHEHSGTPIRILSQDLEGKTLSVDYYHVALPDRNRGYVCCSLRHPHVLKKFRSQVEQLQTILQPSRWLINHDEIRAYGHDPLSKGISPGRILAENLTYAQEIIKVANSNAEIIVFNDMYDPEHNALQKMTLDEKKKKVISFYPMINGQFYGSSDSFDPDTTILNWQTGSKLMTLDGNVRSWQRSLGHFKGLDAKQVISGFYDVVPDAVHAKESVGQRAEAIFAAAVDPAVDIKPSAVCYYTTKRDTAFLKEFAAAANTVLAP